MLYKKWQKCSRGLWMPTIGPLFHNDPYLNANEVPEKNNLENMAEKYSQCRSGSGNFSRSIYSPNNESIEFIKID